MAKNIKRHVQLLNSSVSGKTPSSEDLLYGEIAVNYNAGNEFLSIRNSNDEIIQFKTATTITFDDHLDSGSTNGVENSAITTAIVENEKVVSAALNDLNSRKIDASGGTINGSLIVNGNTTLNGDTLVKSGGTIVNLISAIESAGGDSDNYVRISGSTMTGELVTPKVDAESYDIGGSEVKALGTGLQVDSNGNLIVTGSTSPTDANNYTSAITYSSGTLTLGRYGMANLTASGFLQESDFSDNYVSVTGDTISGDLTVNGALNVKSGNTTVDVIDAIDSALKAFIVNVTRLDTTAMSGTCSSTSTQIKSAMADGRPVYVYEPDFFKGYLLLADCWGETTDCATYTTIYNNIIYKFVIYDDGTFDFKENKLNSSSLNIDSTLSTSSENPVQNKVITTAINGIADNYVHVSGDTMTGALTTTKVDADAYDIGGSEVKSLGTGLQVDSNGTLIVTGSTSPTDANNYTSAITYSNGTLTLGRYGMGNLTASGFLQESDFSDNYVSVTGDTITGNVVINGNTTLNGTTQIKSGNTTVNLADAIAAAGDGNNYPSALTYSNGTLTLGRQGMGNLSASGFLQESDLSDNYVHTSGDTMTGTLSTTKVDADAYDIGGSEVKALGTGLQVDSSGTLIVTGSTSPTDANNYTSALTYSNGTLTLGRYGMGNLTASGFLQESDFSDNYVSVTGDTISGDLTVNGALNVKSGNTTVDVIDAIDSALKPYIVNVTRLDATALSGTCSSTSTQIKSAMAEGRPVYVYEPDFFKGYLLLADCWGETTDCATYTTIYNNSIYKFVIYDDGTFDFKVTKLNSSSLNIDSALSTSSENPVQNKVITTAINGIADNYVHVSGDTMTGELAVSDNEGSYDHGGYLSLKYENHISKIQSSSSPLIISGSTVDIDGYGGANSVFINRNTSGVTKVYGELDVTRVVSATGYVIEGETIRGIGVGLEIDSDGDLNVTGGTGGSDIWEINSTSGVSIVGFGSTASTSGVSAGYNTNSTGNYSFSEGFSTLASGNYSHAEGANTTATTEASHAEGSDTYANGDFSHAEGLESSAMGEASHAEGWGTKSSGVASHAEGYFTKAMVNYSHTEGYATVTSGLCSHAEGNSATSVGDYSHSEGNSTTASGSCSHAEGLNTIAKGINSHAEGEETTSIGACSHAEGLSTLATGINSHAEGAAAQAIGMSSHAEGDNTQAIGEASHAGGGYTSANTNFSFAIGYRTATNATSAQTVVGRFNTLTDDLFIVGNGTSEESRSNAFTVSTGGSVTAAAFNNSSDERKKKNIQAITDDDFEKAKNIEFKQFNFINDPEKDRFGVIAQQLEQIGLGKVVSTDFDGYKSVDYISLLILKIAQLEKEIEELKNK